MRLLLLFLVLCCISSASAIQISEIMYNPGQCDDYDCEWVELYNDENLTINLSGWTIANKSFDNVNISVGEYLIIARELIDGTDADNESFEAFWGNNDRVWNSLDGNYTAVDGNFSLINGNNIIYLNDSGGVPIANATYDTSAANGDNNTWQLVNENWCGGSPTPGLANACADEEEPPPEEDQYDLELEVKIQNATQNVKAKNLFRLTNLDYKTNQPYMNVTVEFIVKLNDDVEYEDEFTVQFKQTKSTGTGNWTPQSFGEYRLCGKITDAPFEDNDEGNNDACEDITVYENKTAFEDVQENITNTTEGNVSITEKQNAAKNGRDYTIGNYTWATKTTPSTAVLLFVFVLLILVVSLLLTAAGTKR